MPRLDEYFPENSFWNHNDTPPGMKIKLFTKPDQLLKYFDGCDTVTAGIYADHVRSILKNNNFKPKKKHKHKENLVTEDTLLEMVKNYNLSGFRFRPVFEKFLKQHKIKKDKKEK